MLIATAILLLGLLAGIGAAQLRGLRLGGVIVVPLVAVYLLRSFSTFPVFVLSTVAAYVSLRFVKARLPLYGRQLYVISIAVGALVPITIFEFLALDLGLRRMIAEIEFLGSILPGIAAYNFHRLSVEDRVLDAVVSLAVLLFLAVVGIGLTIAVGLTPLAQATPPLLLSPESDIAIAFGLTVDRPPLPIIASNRLTIGVLAVGMVMGELVRARYGLRLGGVIAVPLVVLLSFRNGWMLPLWLLTGVLVYVSVQAVHRWTLLYGRVLLATSVIFGLLAAISSVAVIPATHGVLPFFIGLLAGVTAYNLHVSSPAERPATLAAILALLVVITFLARLFVVPPPGGMLRTVPVESLVVGAALLGPACWALYRLERIRPAPAALSGIEPDTKRGGEQR